MTDWCKTKKTNSLFRYFKVEPKREREIYFEMCWCLHGMLFTLLLLQIPSLLFTECSAEKLKIIGGLETQPHGYPYLVGIAIRQPPERSGWCGGALISRHFVLTAAHCLKGVHLATLFIGAHNVHNVSDNTLILDIAPQNMLLHGNWTPRYAVNDIALIRLPKHIGNMFGDSIKSISLPTKETIRIAAGSTLTAMGWGRISANSTQSRPATLHAVNLKILPDDECAQRFHYYNTTLNICLEGNMERSTCRGDSGGPLVHTNTETGAETLVGLTSYGRKCDNPTVLTRISSYLHWIDNRLTNIYPTIKKSNKI